jgi:nicotinamidase-related amidase
MSTNCKLYAEQIGWKYFTLEYNLSLWTEEIVPYFTNNWEFTSSQVFHSIQQLHRHHYILGSPLAQFPKLVAPKGDEIVLNKTSSGVFNSTNISYLLTNLGITKLYVCGGFTNECVLSAVRNAYESNIEVTLVHDACLSTSELDHMAAIRTLRRYSRIVDTDTAVREFEQLKLGIMNVTKIF